MATFIQASHPAILISPQIEMMTKMKWTQLRITLAATTGWALLACDRTPERIVQQDVVSYSPREAGRLAPPTHEYSRKLLAMEGPRRFEYLQSLIVQAGQQCDAVKRGVLNAGLDGTDEWHVECANTGNWLVWISSRPIQVVRP